MVILMARTPDKSSWKYSGIMRRDFRHIHGEPEELPHKKKAVKHDHAHCEHHYVETLRNDRFVRTKCTLCGKRDTRYLWNW